MNAGLIKGSMTTIRNNVTAITYDDLVTMRDTIKQELNNRKPVKAPCKRGRKAIYNSVEERKQVIEEKRKQKLIERNNTLVSEGKPIPKRGRPRKPIDLCDIICN